MVTVVCPQGQHLLVRPAVVSSVRLLHFKALSLSSLPCFLWLTDLKWQIRLVDSLCDVTPSLADREPAVTCWETLCHCQKLHAPVAHSTVPSLCQWETLRAYQQWGWLAVRQHVCVEQAFALFGSLYISILMQFTGRRLTLSKHVFPVSCPLQRTGIMCKWVCEFCWHDGRRRSMKF